MKSQSRSLFAVCFLGALACAAPMHLASATITPLLSPADFLYPVTTIDFDSAADRDIANTLYSGEGIVFSRDDGYAIPIMDWSALARTTTSAPNVIATILGTFEGQHVPYWSTHLNMVFAEPTYEFGAFFGNDQGWGGYTQSTLYVFDVNDALLGSVTMDANENTSVDQFIGVRSTVAFYRARIENNGTDMAVVLDNVSFGGGGDDGGAIVPEPFTAALLGAGLLGMACRRRFMAP